MTININNKDIELRYTLRAMMMYENVAGKSFNPEGITDILTFMYCIVVASSKDYSITFDNFIDYVDGDAKIITEFSEWLTDVVSNNAYLKKN